MPPTAPAVEPAEKTAPALRRLKVATRATPDEGEGTFEALVSNYGETYEIGWYWQERILQGCFAASIEAHNGVFPVCWMHAWQLGPIGDSKVTELDLGLLAKGELYLDVDPLVARLYRAMKADAVNEWSIAFYPEEIIWTNEEPEVDQIVSGDLIEITSCFRGANPATETIDLRSAPVQLVGGEDAARREVIRLRAVLGRPEFGSTEPAPSRAAAEEAPGLEPAAVPPPEVRIAKVLLRARTLRRRSDDNPDAGELAGSLDALIDEIQEALESEDLDQASDLAVSADGTCDDLLEVLGVEDEDEDEAEEAEGASMDAALLSRVLSSRAGRELLRGAASNSPTSTT